MTIRTIIEIGNSRGITIPIDYMRELGWRDGDQVVMAIERYNDGAPELRIAKFQHRLDKVRHTRRPK